MKNRQLHSGYLYWTSSTDGRDTLWECLESVTATDPGILVKCQVHPSSERGLIGSVAYIQAKDLKI